LISGYAGQIFSNALMLPRQSCDILLADALENSECSIRPETKVVLLLGQKALDLYKTGVSIAEQRGCPWVNNGVTYISTLEPQDAIDRQAYFNVNDTADGKGGDDKGHHGKTKRINRRFWLARDLKKAVGYLTEPPIVVKADHILWPRADEVIKLLTSARHFTLT
jgi:hypothetical protein